MAQKNFVAHAPGITYVQDTPPSAPDLEVGDTWLDTSAVPYVVKVWNGAAFDDITTITDFGSPPVGGTDPQLREKRSIWTFVQSSAPTITDGLERGDTWYWPVSGPQFWDGSSWSTMNFFVYIP